MNDTRTAYDDVFGTYWVIGLAALVAVTAAVVVLLVRNRARGRDDFPRSADERTPVELAYAAGLALIAAALVYVTFGAQSDLKARFEAPAGLRVDVIGAKWSWRFEYPRSGAVVQGSRTRTPTLYVPQGVPVEFHGTSEDVIHSFWVPSERFKRDVFPHRTTTWQMTFDDPGFVPAAGACAEFCGLRHSDMRFNVDVLAADRFERWARAAAREGA